MSDSIKIAILGATSQIAKDLILSSSESDKFELWLFGREPAAIEEWIGEFTLSHVSQIQPYSNFAGDAEYDVIINFVGVGDPARAKEMGSEIFDITEKYDNMVLSYLDRHRETKYIFLSSGAIYGGGYQNPVDVDSIAKVDVNKLDSTQWYSVAKLNAEAKHRSRDSLSIIDVRVFNYFSHTQDMEARFLITDIVRAIRDKTVFETNSEDIIRDFITPPDFYNLIRAIIDAESINTAIDCYTKAPVSKSSLLSELEQDFNLRYLIQESCDSINATGLKLNYYSEAKAPKGIKFTPEDSSISGITREIGLVLGKVTNKETR